MLPMTVLRRAGYSSLRLAARSVAVRSEILQSRHGGLVSTRAAIQRRPSPISNHPSAVRWFQSEGEYHNVADETLESIQDALDALFEGMSQSDQELEVSLSSGVLTVSLPPHGTWVLNKQTPNQVSSAVGLYCVPSVSIIIWGMLD
jgi:hypothetical protein